VDKPGPGAPGAASLRRPSQTPSGEKPWFLGVSVDISERKRVQEEIRPLAEETGLILPMGEACRQARSWQAPRTTATPLVVSVNLSARQFQQPNLVEQVRDALQETGLDPAVLWLEITESAVMQDVEGGIHTLEALKALGVGLAIDDFGTGYSSLSYLRRFPVDTIKVDRSFVRCLETDHVTVAIVQATVSLAHALGMDVTAEGIETAGQLACVQPLHCDRGQGYYFAHAMPADELTAILSEGSRVRGS
jgi:EAL domain-containing protein (putative c-di-GMP-specific phosphodiesterase class I)